MPYHAWAYELDGSLSTARQMQEDFNPADYSLKPCHIGLIEGFIFINLTGDDASDIEELRANVLPFFQPHGIPNAKVAHTETHDVEANWKLVVENFRECCHCIPPHPEYTAVNAYVRAGAKNFDAYTPAIRLS